MLKYLLELWGFPKFFSTIKDFNQQTAPFMSKFRTYCFSNQRVVKPDNLKKSQKQGQPSFLLEQIDRVKKSDETRAIYQAQKRKYFIQQNIVIVNSDLQVTQRQIQCRRLGPVLVAVQYHKYQINWTTLTTDSACQDEFISQQTNFQQFVYKNEQFLNHNNQKYKNTIEQSNQHTAKDFKIQQPARSAPLLAVQFEQQKNPFFASMNPYNCFSIIKNSNNLLSSLIINSSISQPFQLEHYQQPIDIEAEIPISQIFSSSSQLSKSKLHSNQTAERGPDSLLFKSLRQNTFNPFLHQERPLSLLQGHQPVQKKQYNHYYSHKKYQKERIYG